MFDFLVNDKLKTICLTYPKGASTSIRTILMPRFEDSELGINVNEFGEKWSSKGVYNYKTITHQNSW